MSWNLERATSLVGDIVADYYLPKLGINLLSRHFARKDLDRRIDSYCQDRGGISDAERKRLHGELAQEFKQPRWDVYRFPALPLVGLRIPFFASLNIGTSWARSWAGAGDTVFGVGYGLLPEEGVLAGWGLAGAWALSPHLPWTKNLGFVQNGAYSRAMDTVLGKATDVKTKKDFYDNVRCNDDGPPSSGNKITEGEGETETDTQFSSRSSETMLCSALDAGGIIPTEQGLADSLAAVEGSTRNRIGSETGNLMSPIGKRINAVPMATPLSIPLTAPKFTPVLRAAPVVVP